MSGRWLARAAPSTDAGIRLFLFPYAGGGGGLYRDWDRAFAPGTDVLPVQLPGREERFREPAISQIDQLSDVIAEALLPLCDRPFILFGWSMGARIAHAVARRCEVAGRVPHLLVVAANSAPHLPYRRPRIHDLSGEDFWRGVANFGGAPRELLAEPELRDLVEPMLRADFALIETAPLAKTPSVTCPVAAITATEDALVDANDVAAWQEATSGPSLLLRVSGDHFCLRDDPGSVQAAVRLALDWAPPGVPEMAPKGLRLTLRDIGGLMEV